MQWSSRGCQPTNFITTNQAQLAAHDCVVCDTSAASHGAGNKRKRQQTVTYFDVTSQAELIPNKKATPRRNTGHQMETTAKSHRTASVWTPELDARLTKGVRKYGDQGWDAVADYVGMSYAQCANRWSNFMCGGRRDSIKQGPWSETEVEELQDAVLRYTTEPRWFYTRKVMTNEQIRWADVGKELNRSARDCKAQWQKGLKRGPFTALEDELIQQRVAEWGDKGRGLWSSLQRELGRPEGTIKQRWNALDSSVES